MRTIAILLTICLLTIPALASGELISARSFTLTPREAFLLRTARLSEPVLVDVDLSIPAGAQQLSWVTSIAYYQDGEYKGETGQNLTRVNLDPNQSHFFPLRYLLSYTHPSTVLPGAVGYSISYTLVDRYFPHWDSQIVDGNELGTLRVFNPGTTIPLVIWAYSNLENYELVAIYPLGLDKGRKVEDTARRIHNHVYILQLRYVVE